MHNHKTANTWNRDTAILIVFWLLQQLASAAMRHPSKHKITMAGDIIAQCGQESTCLQRALGKQVPNFPPRALSRKAGGFLPKKSSWQEGFHLLAKSSWWAGGHLPTKSVSLSDSKNNFSSSYTR